MKRLAIPVLLWYLGFCSQANGQGIITTVAGSNWVFPANVTVALNAPLGQVSGVTVDSHGNVYLAACLRGRRGLVRVTPGGETSLVLAGNNVVGVAFSPLGTVILATGEAVYDVDLGVEGLNLF